MNSIAIEILNRYPLATETVRDWFLEKLKKSLEKDEGIPNEMKDYMLQIGILDETLAIILDDNPRNFFDVFDDNRIFVEIRLSKYAGGGFYYVINEIEDNQIYESRIPCERAAVVKAFEILE